MTDCAPFQKPGGSDSDQQPEGPRIQGFSRIRPGPPFWNLEGASGRVNSGDLDGRQGEVGPGRGGACLLCFCI